MPDAERFCASARRSSTSSASGPSPSVADADAFVPHFGGAVANVAVLDGARRRGVALAGGAGDDPVGPLAARASHRRGSRRLLFELIEGGADAAGARAVDALRRADFRDLRRDAPSVVHALADRVDRRCRLGRRCSSARTRSSGPRERDVDDAGAGARAVGGSARDLRPQPAPRRWRSSAEAAAAANACVAGRAARPRQRGRGGVDDRRVRPRARGARAVRRPARGSVVITLGPAARSCAARCRADVPGVAPAVDQHGRRRRRADRRLLARLALAGSIRAAAAVRRCARRSRRRRRACERWGALD